MVWKSITEYQIADVRADKKTAKSVEKYMISRKAIYFEGKYLPIAQIQSVSLHDSTYNPHCCCGRGIPVKKIKIEYGADKPLILMVEKEQNAAKMTDMIEDARSVATNIRNLVKQGTGIEPASSAWEADVLPMY